MLPVLLLSERRIRLSRTDRAGPYRERGGSRHCVRLFSPACHKTRPFSYGPRDRTGPWREPSCIRKCCRQNPAGSSEFLPEPTLPEHRTEMPPKPHPRDSMPIQTRLWQVPYRQAKQGPENDLCSSLSFFSENPTLQPLFLQWKKNSFIR